MPVSLTMEESRPRRYAAVHGALIALCRTWAAYTVRRAIIDVTSTSEQDYREFGLDKAEMLAALEMLRGELEGSLSREAAHDAPAPGAPRLAIVVTKREAPHMSPVGRLVGSPSTE
jgi:hypothetical protein